MIVRDEADWLEQCINSVRPIISEVIIVDTGSQDQTKAIAKRLGARVFEQAWQNDFALHRNFSIAQATGDWILILDADEAIAAEDLDELKKLTLNNKVCHEFLQRHYSDDQRLSDFIPVQGEYPAWERKYGGYFTSNLCRLFPNNIGLEYRGRVHELVEHSIREHSDLIVQRTRIPIHHYGHTEQVKLKKKKSSLYTPLGEQKAKEQPTDWKSLYELGVEHNCNGRLIESAEAFLKAARLNPKYTLLWINFGYVLMELGNYPEAIKALKNALVLEPQNPEAHCNLAVTYMRQGKWPFAEAHLLKAIQSKPDYTNAYCNLGQTYMSQRKIDQAIACFQEAIRQFPRNASAKADLANALAIKGDFQQARELLKDAVQLQPGLSKAHYYLGCVCKHLNETQLAVESLQKFCHLEESKFEGQLLPADMQRTLGSIRDICSNLAGK